MRSHKTVDDAHHAGAAREVRRSELQVLARAVGVRSVLPHMMIPSFVLLGIVPAVVSAVFNALPQTVGDAHHVGAAGEGATGR
jgi:hypothetical protein